VALVWFSRSRSSISLVHLNPSSTHIPETSTPKTITRDRSQPSVYTIDKTQGGWPTFTFFVKVGTHAAGVTILILASPH
jgi:hypothetical protein